MVETDVPEEVPQLVDEAYINEPDSLQNICIKTACDNYNKSLFYPKSHWDTSPVLIRDDVRLPGYLADELLSFLLNNSKLPKESVLSAFSDSSKCRLHFLKLQNVVLEYHALLSLSNTQALRRLDLFHVSFKSVTGNECLLQKFLNKQTHYFHIGPKVSTKPDVRFQKLSKKNFPNLKSLKIVDNELAWYLLVDPDDPIPLTSLNLSDIPQTKKPDKVQFEATAMSRLLQSPMFNSSRMIRTYDADGDHKCDTVDEVTSDDLQQVIKMEPVEPELDEMDSVSRTQSPLLPQYRLELFKNSLLSLVLSSTCLGPGDIRTIFGLKQLRHLDISSMPERGNQEDTNVSRPDMLTMWTILDELPYLESLDLSSTIIGDHIYFDALSKPITGDRYLPTPIKRRLEFLGLSETQGCEVTNIHMLAKKVTGYASELQVMTGIERYVTRADRLTICFNHLYSLNRNQKLTCPHKVLRLLMETMDLHPDNGKLLLTCTANFFFLSRKFYVTYSKRQRNQIILAIVKCLEVCQHEHQVVRNCLLTMFHFDLPGDLVFIFARVARIILKTFYQHRDNHEINSIAAHMCNTLVCSLEHDLKKEVSKVDFVMMILKVVKERLENDVCDEVMEVCWSTLWNVTDETPKNSYDFISLDGLDVMQKCFEKFSNNQELHKNIMGLVGNIAEVKSLRASLQQSDKINTFRNLMNRNDNIEIAYNSCGTLAHIMSDGEEAWIVDDVSRDEVRREMFDVIQKWDLEANRHINYRSFKPILQLLECQVPESVHWACWALCNLSGREDRYCRLIITEDGKRHIEAVTSMDVRDETKQLARVLLARLEAFNERVTSRSQNST